MTIANFVEKYIYIIIMIIIKTTLFALNSDEMKRDSTKLPT